MILEDRRLNVKNIAASLGISAGSANNILLKIANDKFVCEMGAAFETDWIEPSHK